MTAINEKMSFKGTVSPNWCPGCGDYGLLASTTRALEDLGYDPKDVVIVSGIGCSSNFPHFATSYGYHTVHGRALPAAMAIKSVNPDLKVIAVGGDGDGYGIGMGHFIHAIRRDLDITYLVMNNQIYGLTLGQPSPTTTVHHITVTTPDGVEENPINPITLSLGAGCNFVARGFSGKTRHLENLIKEGIEHPGFAFIDDLSPCVTFNKLNTYGWFKERVYDLGESGHDASDPTKAFQKGLEWGEKVPIGLFYKKMVLKDSNQYNVFKQPLERNQSESMATNIMDYFK